MKFSVPILLIAYNRYDTTEKVFNIIRQIRPEKLFFAVDCPKEGADTVKVDRVKDIIKQIDWDCQLETFFPDNNLGPRINVSSAITWFFEKVEAGIILEHDCLPDDSFFYFCEELLEKYKNDSRVMHIGGTFFQKTRVGNGDYYFSRLTHIWGWATWRRAWQYYDLEMKSFPAFRDQAMIKSIFDNVLIRRFWTDSFLLSYQGDMSWDNQWLYAVFANNGLCINPNVNLVSNIGFGPEALNTKNSKSRLANIAAHELKFPLSHPLFMLPDTQADYYANKKVFRANYFHLVRIILIRLGLLNTVKRLRLDPDDWMQKLKRLRRCVKRPCYGKQRQ
jgi:hypothetical protein